MTMTTDEVLAIFREAGAYLEGHFILSSGRRSGNYLQCARVLMNAERAGKFGCSSVPKNRVYPDMKPLKSI